MLQFLRQEPISEIDAQLLKAAEEGNLTLVRAMLMKGANANCYNEDMQTPLHIAVERDDMSMTKYLLGQPTIDVNAQDSTANTALHIAIEFRHLKLVPVLLQHGASTRIANNMHWTALHVATENCLPYTAKLLIEKGSPVNMEDAFGMTPLWISVLRRKCPVMAHLLIRNGALINMMNSNGHTILSEAVLHARTPSDLDAIKMLIRNGGIINFGDSIGKRTPLHFAALTNNVKVTKLLLENGADPNMLDRMQQLPYTTAIIHSNFEVAQVLESYMKKMKEENEKALDS